MPYVYCTYLSFGDAVAPIGAATHHVFKGCLILVSFGRVGPFLSDVSTVTVVPAVLLSGRG